MLTLPHIAALTTLYNEPHRHYHNLNHVQYCLREVDTLLEDKVVDHDEADALEVAIWFHDAVYDPKAKPGINEKRSADLMLRSIAKELPYKFLDKNLVETMILRTAAHHDLAGRWPTSSKQMVIVRYFLDIDLSILGTDRDTYMEYAEGIAKEYSFVPDKLYRQKRVEILRSWQKMPGLFHTDRYKKLTDVARENLGAEIAHHKYPAMKVY